MATETTGTHTSPISLEEAGICVDSHGGAIGMPQLCGDWFPNQIFWLVITLVVIYLILSKIALPRIATVLAERQGTITNDIAAAEELMLQVKEAEASYNQALADARAEAQKIVAEAKADIQTELDKSIAEADAEIAVKTAESEKAIAEIRDTAMESVREVAQATAGDIVAALGGSADVKTIDAAVAAQMKG